MIDDVLSDLGIYPGPIPAGEDFVEKYSSEKKLFETIEKCLHDNGIRSGYTLGRFGDHEAYALFKYRGYWIVSFTERREHFRVGLFWSAIEATDFFLCKMFRSNNVYFDWKKYAIDVIPAHRNVMFFTIGIAEMIEEILADLGIASNPVCAGKSFLEQYSSEKKLFETIEQCLHDNGVRSGYTLGRFGDHEAYSLFKYGGYWIVSFTERKETTVHGLFWSADDATEFF